MLNPITLRAFWWASLLLAASGLGLSYYAGHVAAAQALAALQTRAETLAQAIEHSPADLNRIVGGEQGAVVVYDSQLQLLAASLSAAGRTTDQQSLRTTLDHRTPATSTAETTAAAVVPIGTQGRPAALLRLAEPTSTVFAASDALRSRLMGLTGIFTLFGMFAVGLYLRTAERRVRQQRQFVEGVLFETPVESTGEDEIGALARSLRNLPPRLEVLNRQAQSELSLRELILKTMSEGIVAVGKDMHVTFGNENFARFTGVRDAISVGPHILTFVRKPEFLEALSDTIRQAVPNRLRIELNGRRLEVQTIPLSGGAIAVFRDVTELERLERVRRDFITNISHELRTPLAAIQGYAETLLEGAHSAEGPERKFVQTIHRHALRLSHVAADLATLSEIEGAVSSEPLEPLSLRMVVASATRAVEGIAESRDVRLLTGELPDVEVAGHRLRFEQALTNLLDNAIRFSHPGGEVFIEGRYLNPAEVGVTISDNGIGIPSEHVQRIFERFYRVDKARSRETGGTGLGLSIVKHVAEQMHGRVLVESQLGKGSKFTLVMPFEHSSMQQVAERNDYAPPPPAQ